MFKDCGNPAYVRQISFQHVFIVVVLVVIIIIIIEVIKANFKQ